MTVNIDNAYYNKITDKKRQAVLVRSNIERLTSQFFFDKGFIFVEPPILHEAIANKKYEIYLPMYNGMYSLSSSNALFMGMYASEFNKVFLSLFMLIGRLEIFPILLLFHPSTWRRS